jgi:hypothetical protein
MTPRKATGGGGAGPGVGIVTVEYQGGGEPAAPQQATEAVPVQVALARIMGELPAIGKDDKAPANMGGYAYRGIELITRHLQPLLAKHGVVIIPEVIERHTEHAPDARPAWQDTYLVVRWHIVGPDGSTLVACTHGVGRDHTDKGTNKAQTQAYKYLLMHLFCIADAKDDVDGADTSAAHAPAPPSPDVLAAADLYGQLRALRGTPLADELKVWAKAQGGSLMENALRDPEWRATVAEQLAELQERDGAVAAQDAAEQPPVDAAEAEDILDGSGY